MFDKETTGGHFALDESLLHANALELKFVLFGLISLCSDLRQTHIKVLSDNITAACAINNMSSCKSLLCGQEVKRIWSWPLKSVSHIEYGVGHWDKCKPYFSNKHAHGDSKIILIEKENIITNKNEVVQKETLLVNNDEIAKILNNHFSETVEKLNTFEWPSNEKYENMHNEKLTTIIKKFENHPSIMKIKSKYAIQEKFSIKPVTAKDVENIIKTCPITKRLEEKYLLTFLSNLDLLIKC